MGAACDVCTPQGGHLASLPASLQLVAWMRRRSGTDAEFGRVFEEVFEGRDAVGELKFVQVFAGCGIRDIDLPAVFRAVASSKGTVGAADFEAWQERLDTEAERSIVHLREFLKDRFTTPKAAWNSLGKGEGDCVTSSEFSAGLQSQGFTAKDPEQLFRDVDKDFSGEISFSEFKAVLRSVTENAVSPRGNKSGVSPRGNKSGVSPRRKGKKKQ